MNSLDEYLAFCSCSERVTEIAVSLMDMENIEFVNDTFCRIHKSNPFCRSYGPHIYGVNLALNRKMGVSYIYHCPRGLSFFCIPISQKYVMIVGPAVLSERQKEAQEYGNTLDSLPVVSEEKMRDIEKWFRLTVGVEENPVMIADQNGLMTEGVFVPAYSIDTLRELFAKIRKGDYAGAQPLLDQLTDSIIEKLSYDFDALKWQAKELFIRMGRAAVKGGAERDEAMRFCMEYLQAANDVRQVDGYRIWLNTALKRLVDFVFDINDVKHRRVIFKTNEYIKKHLSEKITISDAADNVFLSKSYFSKIMKSELGMSFNDYLKVARIRRSKVLLRDSKLTLAEIAQEVGFADQAYFTRVFKEQVGLTPGRYRTGSV